MRKYRNFLVASLALSVGLALAACGGSDPAADAGTDAALSKIDAMPAGAERESALLAGAKKEGEVTWYTGLIPEQLTIPMKKAFEKKYPGIKVNYYRAGSSAIAAKMLTEAKADSPRSDVWDGAHAAGALKAAGAAVKYVSPSSADFPDTVKDPDGYWTSANIYIKGIAFNSDEIDPADAPETYEDLLDPSLKGKMAWTPEATGGADFVGNVLETMGDKNGKAYLEKLSEQDIAVVSVSSRELVNMAMAAQYKLVIQVFNNHVAISKAEGAAIEWRPLTAASQQLNPMGLTKGAEHPYAGRLLLDFVLSEAGQQVFRDADYIPANSAVKPLDPELTPESGGYKATLMSPQLIEEKNADWIKIFEKVNSGDPIS